MLRASKNRWTGRLVCFAVAVALLAGCSGAKQEPAQKSASGTPAPSTTDNLPQDAVAPLAASGQLPEQTLTVAYFSSPHLDAIRRLAPEFTKYTQGRVKFKFEELPIDSWRVKSATTLSAGSDSWDIIDLYNIAATQYVQAGWVEPLDSYMANPKLFNAKLFDLNDFPKAVLDTFTVGGKLYALPIEASAILLYYRTDLLQKYGVAPPPAPPESWTWDQYLEAAQKLQDGLRKDGKNDVFATVFTGKRTGNSASENLQAIWSYGLDIMDDKFQPKLTDPAVVKAVEKYTSQLTKLHLASPGVVGYDYPEILGAFQQGKAAMAIEWNAAAPTLLDPAKSPETAGKVGFAVLPRGEGTPASQPRIYPSIHTVAITKFSKHKEAAFEFMAWYASKQAAGDYVVKGGGSSGRISLLTSADVVKLRPEYPVLMEALKLYHSTPAFTQWGDLKDSLMGPQFNAIYTGTETTQSGMQKLQEQSLDYLKRAGVLK